MFSSYMHINNGHLFILQYTMLSSHFFLVLHDFDVSLMSTLGLHSSTECNMGLQKNPHAEEWDRSVIPLVAKPTLCHITTKLAQWHSSTSVVL